MSEFSAEFCPRCTWPLEFSHDPDRLCEVCGWFGDQSEILEKPPSRPDRLNPILAVVQCLALYREVCQKELIAEQMYDAGDVTEDDLRKIRLTCRHAIDAAVKMFVSLQKQALAQKRPQKRILHRIQGIVSWPADWPRNLFNTSNEPCDNLVGPCICGAWHNEAESWIQNLLIKYNAEIVEIVEE
jgi:hypothetical protein